MRIHPASVIVLTLFVGGLYSRDFSCRWEPGLLQEYRLFLETWLHLDLDHREKHLKTESRYLIRFYVVESTPQGEALVASICRLEEAGVDAASRDAYPKPARELEARIDSFSRKEDFSFLILDRWGHILRGRMPWPEAVNYHVAKILEGIGIGKPGPVRGSCFRNFGVGPETCSSPGRGAGRRLVMSSTACSRNTGIRRRMSGRGRFTGRRQHGSLSRRRPVISG